MRVSVQTSNFYPKAAPPQSRSADLRLSTDFLMGAEEVAIIVLASLCAARPKTLEMIDDGQSAPGDMLMCVTRRLRRLHESFQHLQERPEGSDFSMWHNAKIKKAQPRRTWLGFLLRLRR